jgi:hypothetical protein
LFWSGIDDSSRTNLPEGMGAGRIVIVRGDLSRRALAMRRSNNVAL